jgi:hypothetical protein
MPENKTIDLAYWINERESIRMRREAGVPAPWTPDPVMATVRFCNVHREDDKVTRYIRGSNTYSRADIPVWVVVLARMVNRISSLDRLASYVANGDLDGIKATLKHFRDGGTVIWGNAYTISTCGRAMDKVDYVIGHVVSNVLTQEEVHGPTYRSLKETFEWLTGIDGLGSFLAGQVVADLKNIKGHPLNTAPDWWTWSAHGPGSLRGLTAYYGSKVSPATYQEAISICYDEVRPLLANYVGELHMQDFQNCMCEFSKFIRVRDGDGHARNSYVAG